MRSHESITVAGLLGSVREAFCYLTLVPVQAATTSCMVHGVTMTIKPRDMAAIVREAFVLSRLSCATSCRQIKMDLCKILYDDLLQGVLVYRLV